MKHVLVRYKVKQDRVAENVALIERVFAELAQSRPAGLHYASFTTGDGRFVHLVEIEGDGNPLRELPAFRAFVEGISERCDEPPVNEVVDVVGSYEMFGR